LGRIEVVSTPNVAEQQNRAAGDARDKREPRQIKRAESFCARFGLRVPILLAPMAGASAPSLSIAVANAGGLGSCGVLLMQPDEITAWAAEVRSNSNGAFQLNVWIPDPAPKRDLAHEAQVRAFLRVGDQRSRLKPPTRRRRTSRLNAKRCCKPVLRLFRP
jgi:hypothetical protein